MGFPWPSGSFEARRARQGVEPGPEGAALEVAHGAARRAATAARQSIWGDARSATIAVNAAGTVVGAGDRYDTSGNRVGLAALRWDAGRTTATPLDPLDAAPDGTFACRGVGVNDSDTVVGACARYDASNNWLADVPVRWAAGSTKPDELGGLGASRTGTSVAYAMGINDVGAAFGVAEQFTPDGTLQGWRAVCWAPGETKPHPLKPLSRSLSGQGYEYARRIAFMRRRASRASRRRPWPTASTPSWGSTTGPPSRRT